MDEIGIPENTMKENIKMYRTTPNFVFLLTPLDCVRTFFWLGKELHTGQCLSVVCLLGLSVTNEF